MLGAHSELLSNFALSASKRGQPAAALLDLPVKHAQVNARDVLPESVAFAGAAAGAAAGWAKKRPDVAPPEEAPIATRVCF